MPCRVKKLDTKLRSMPPAGFILVMGIAVYLPTILLLPLYHFFPDGYVIEVPNEDRFIFDSILFVVIAPFVETLVFQCLIIKSFRKLFKLNNGLLVLLSSLIFGLVHSPFVTQFTAFFTGLILAYSFVIYERKEFPPVLMVTILHAIRNLPIVLLS